MKQPTRTLQESRPQPDGTATMYCTPTAVPATTQSNIQYSEHTEQTYVKLIILSHLAHKLLSNPFSHPRSPIPIQPTQPLYFPHDPFLLALLGKDPAEA